MGGAIVCVFIVYTYNALSAVERWRGLGLRTARQPHRAPAAARASR